MNGWHTITTPGGRSYQATLINEVWYTSPSMAYGAWADSQRADRPHGTRFEHHTYGWKVYRPIADLYVSTPSTEYSEAN
jgi:hypothetical protein